jgi:hypothetical protein
MLTFAANIIIFFSRHPSPSIRIFSISLCLHAYFYIRAALTNQSSRSDEPAPCQAPLGIARRAAPSGKRFGKLDACLWFTEHVILVFA